MLCGRSPFLGNPNKPVNTNPKNNQYDDSVASIIRRIKNGEFRMDSDAWRYVSPAAKTITKGLLTVDVKKRMTMEALYTSSWINTSPQKDSSHNNNNPSPVLLTPMLLNDPNSNVIDRSLKQTFNAYHTVARETFHSSNQHHCLGGHRSSSVSSSSSSLSSVGSSLSSSGAIRCHNNNDYLQQQQQFLQLAVSSAAAVQQAAASCSSSHNFAAAVTSTAAFSSAAASAAVSIAPLMAEAFTGVSYQLMPTAFYPSSNSSVSITKMGPMTRSRKRKMQDGPLLVASTSPAGGSGNSSSNNSTSGGSGSGGAVSITPTYPNVTVTKRERTMQPSEANFPAASNMQYCATARAVVVTPALTATAVPATWTSNSRSVTITID